MQDPLSQDSFEVESWEKLLLWSLNAGRKKEFIEKINKHIIDSNGLEKIRFDKYIDKRRSQMKAQDIEEESRMRKLDEKTKT